MSVHLSIKFLAGRYHATPWDHQVNEGVVEWPPSPWRILRTLVAVAYHSANPPGKQALCQLVTDLAASLPQYSLPPWEAAHTRHYMPVWREGKATSSLVIDTFLALGNGMNGEKPPEVIVSWPETQLDDASAKLLERLCQEVNYLGRSESWAEIEVVKTAPSIYNATPLHQVSTDGEKQNRGKQVKILAPLSEEGLKGFQAALAVLPKPKKKQKLFAPTNVLEALELDVADLFSQGWNGIPGTQWVTYEVKEPTQQQASSSKLFVEPPNFARYALSSNVLPSLTEALSLGERFRTSLIKRSDGEAVFSGRNQEGQPSQQNHQHAWYLPEDIDGDGRIDHVAIYAAQGFDTEKAILALQGLQKVWGKERFDIQTILVALGQVEHYRADLETGEIKGRSSVVGKAKVWRSLTPVVLPRFPGEKIDPETGWLVDGPEYQVQWLLEMLGKDRPIGIEVIEDGKSVGLHPWYQFQRKRFQGNGARGPSKGYGFRITFAQPQEGPIALGYAAHFGLGVFVPEE